MVKRKNKKGVGFGTKITDKISKNQYISTYEVIQVDEGDNTYLLEDLTISANNQSRGFRTPKTPEDMFACQLGGIPVRGGVAWVK